MCSGSRRFPGRARLTEPVDYQRVFRRNPQRSGNRWMTVLTVSNSLGYPRLGLAISRKVARSAVARNRIKRVVRESFRHWQDRLGGVDIVVLGRQGVVAQKGRTLDEALEKTWKQIIDQCAGSSSD